MSKRFVSLGPGFSLTVKQEFDKETERLQNDNPPHLRDFLECWNGRKGKRTEEDPFPKWMAVRACHYLKEALNTTKNNPPMRPPSIQSVEGRNVMTFHYGGPTKVCELKVSVTYREGRYFISTIRGNQDGRVITNENILSYPKSKNYTDEEQKNISRLKRDLLDSRNFSLDRHRLSDMVEMGYKFSKGSLAAGDDIKSVIEGFSKLSGSLRPSKSEESESYMDSSEDSRIEAPRDSTRFEGPRPTEDQVVMITVLGGMIDKTLSYSTLNDIQKKTADSMIKRGWIQIIDFEGSEIVGFTPIGKDLERELTGSTYIERD